MRKIDFLGMNGSGILADLSETDFLRLCYY